MAPTTKNKHAGAMTPPAERPASHETDVIDLGESLPTPPDADLRLMQIGSGFNYDFYGPTTTVKRCGTELIFAVEGKRAQGFVESFIGKLAR